MDDEWGTFGDASAAGVACGGVNASNLPWVVHAGVVAGRGCR